MRIDSRGQLVDQPEIRAGFIGCGSHSFRNIYPTFQYAPVKLAAVCDLQFDKARAFAQKFGAPHAYDDPQQMLDAEKLDAVFIVTNYDPQGRPRYPALASQCLRAGCHVWIEKPPAACAPELEQLQAHARAADRIVMVGLKKMFFPANQKAKQLMALAEFGQPQLALLQYPQLLPAADDFRRYLHEKQNISSVVYFLDHLCHPASLLIYLLGMPNTLCFQRSSAGTGLATFTFKSGAIASLAMTHGAAHNCGMERTEIIGQNGHRIVVDNNLRVRFDRSIPYAPNTGYGAAPDYFQGDPHQASALWEPEFSLGQLYNKGLFLLGYYNEVNEFARAILDRRSPSAGTLDDAIAVTKIFEAFAQGPGKVINLS